eukprot:2266877-Pyramimonas_sp.AAC.1
MRRTCGHEGRHRRAPPCHNIVWLFSCLVCALGNLRGYQQGTIWDRVRVQVSEVRTATAASLDE